MKVLILLLAIAFGGDGELVPIPPPEPGIYEWRLVYPNCDRNVFADSYVAEWKFVHGPYTHGIPPREWGTINVPVIVWRDAAGGEWSEESSLWRHPSGELIVIPPLRCPSEI